MHRGAGSSKKCNGRLCFLPWIEKGRSIPASGVPDDETTRLLVYQSVRLPRALCGPWIIDRTINELERMKCTKCVFTTKTFPPMSMQLPRGHERARGRSVYRHMSYKTGVPWSGREYDPEDYAGGSQVNMALSAAHACLYCVAHSVIVALGCAPSLLILILYPQIPIEHTTTIFPPSSAMKNSLKLSRHKCKMPHGIWLSLVFYLHVRGRCRCGG